MCLKRLFTLFKPANTKLKQEPINKAQMRQQIEEIKEIMLQNIDKAISRSEPIRYS